MPEYEVYYGCYEWQQYADFDTEQEANEFIRLVENGQVSIGLYTADFAYITHSPITAEENQ